ncbi:MAG: helix-turn-helix domain-containing protein [Clostridiales bacterium]|nr:helix-turn-helix domain-containing protein [Clostridiales bacterium]
MNDFIFGEYIYNLRKKANLSQAKLAKLINVSNKAISKWETGVSKPALKQAQALAKIFNVTVEDILNCKLKNKEKIITKIVVTGGPCAGKSTAMAWLNEEFTKKGYTVLTIPETATELILGGIAPWTCETVYDFQKAVFKLQLEKEMIFENIAKTLNKSKILIVCDRGLIDGKAYLNDLEFENLLSEFNLSDTTTKDRYDGVFHLVTAAKGAEEFYTLSNNKARTETIEEARVKDDKLISCWTGHSHFRVIENSSNFEDKMKKFIEEISALLGDPIHYELERKFLIEYPNLKELEKNNNCQKVEIIQTYLISDVNEEVRIRQRGINNNFAYTKTTKKQVKNGKRIEVEKKITKDEYLNLLLNANTNKKQIRKTRYCLMENNHYFEIDIYPEWKDKAIMEIEINNENEKFIIPSFIKVIKEVTNDINYSNNSLSENNFKI